MGTRNIRSCKPVRVFVCLWLIRHYFKDDLNEIFLIRNSRASLVGSAFLHLLNYGTLERKRIRKLVYEQTCFI